MLLIPILELSLEDRRHLGTIMRCILQLNSSPVFTYVTRDPETLARVAAAVEYDFDPNLPRSVLRERPPLADFIAKHTSRFVEVVHLPTSITTMIHRHYRLLFLRDTLLGEEVGINLSNLAALISTISADICLAILDDRSLLPSLVSEANVGGDNALRFLKEFLSLCSRALQQERRVELLAGAFANIGTTLVNYLERILRKYAQDEDNLGSSDSAILAEEVFTLIAQLCPAILVDPILRSIHPKPSDGLDCVEGGIVVALLRILCECWNSDAVEAAADAIRSLFDGALLPSDKDRLLSDFYEHYIRFCIPTADMSGASAQFLCSLLSTFATAHSYRMKYFVMRNSVIIRVLSCLEHPSRVVRVEVIRFVRTIFGLKDDFYFRHIIKGDLLRQLFHSLDGKDALITSMILDTLEFVRVEGIFSIMEYIVTQYGTQFEAILHADSFDRLKIRYEQLNEKTVNNHVTRTEHQPRDQFSINQDEDSYFECDDESGSALQTLAQVYSDCADDGDGHCAKRVRQESASASATDFADQLPPLPPLRPKFAHDDDIAPIFLLKNGRGKPLIADELERRPGRAAISFNLTTKKL